MDPLDLSRILTADNVAAINGQFAKYKPVLIIAASHEALRAEVERLTGLVDTLESERDDTLRRIARVKDRAAIDSLATWLTINGHAYPHTTAVETLAWVRVALVSNESGAE